MSSCGSGCSQGGSCEVSKEEGPPSLVKFGANRISQGPKSREDIETAILSQILFTPCALVRLGEGVPHTGI